MNMYSSGDSVAVFMQRNQAALPGNSRMPVLIAQRRIQAFKAAEDSEFRAAMYKMIAEGLLRFRNCESAAIELNEAGAKGECYKIEYMKT